MSLVHTTDFFTPESTRLAPEERWCSVRGVRPRRILRLLASVWLLWLCWAAPLRAAEPLLEQVSLQRSADALYLSARIELAPSPAVEDALLKGVPLYFVWQADLYRDRWYWTDKRVASAMRTLRLAYQPLTRRWRLSVSNDPEANRSAPGLQYALHQNFESLAEAMGGVSRVLRWRVADTASLRDGTDERVEFSFRLDLSLLPRPFQIGMANESDWTVELIHRINVPAHADPELSPAEHGAGSGAAAATVATPGETGR
jgi:hypothetical protein